MKLWDSLTTCLILLSAVRGASLLLSREESPETAESPVEMPPVQIRTSVNSQFINLENTAEREDALERGNKCKTPCFLRDTTRDESVWFTLEMVLQWTEISSEYERYQLVWSKIAKMYFIAQLEYYSQIIPKPFSGFIKKYLKYRNVWAMWSFQ